MAKRRARSDIFGFLTGSSKRTWQPLMTAKTNALSYWLNWRFFLCAVFILTPIVGSAILIWKYEGRRKPKHRVAESQQEPSRSLYEDEAWYTCLKTVHPVWLLAFRLFGFFMLLALITANVIVDGGGIFYFYTQWTCTLVTIYFAFGSSISIYGCCKSGKRVDGNEADSMSSAEQGDYIPPTMMEAGGVSSMPKSSNINEERDSRKTAGAWIYTFQIIYQTCAGAVALTDAVFWLILYPFLTSKDFGLNFRFPMFRIAYFILWTATFVIFQWILHACVNLWWPYSFLDLSSSYAPLWYVGVGLMHLLCYGFFSSFVRLKHFWFSRSFPGSYRALR